jgi:hypothetical protein
MDSLHVIPEVPVAWKTIPGDASLAAIIGAEEGFVAVSMHGMSFTLVAEKTSCG